MLQFCREIRLLYGLIDVFDGEKGHQSKESEVLPFCDLRRHVSEKAADAKKLQRDRRSSCRNTALLNTNTLRRHPLFDSPNILPSLTAVASMRRENTSVIKCRVLAKMILRWPTTENIPCSGW